MGIYVFNTRLLEKLLVEDAANAASAHDFGRDIVPSSIAARQVFAYPFQDVKTRAQSYWRDVGTIDAFWKANIDLTGFNTELDLWDRQWPIWTYSESVPPAKFVHDEENRRGSAVSSLVSGGCIISGTEVRNSLLFTGVHANSYAVLDHAVVLPYVTIGRHARLRNVVIDRGVTIPQGLVVGEDPEKDARFFRVTEAGITLITERMLEARAAALG
jgi:glucose-1-phosphate adenylyltransferase